jgi:hypothetical protein
MNHFEPPEITVRRLSPTTLEVYQGDVTVLSADIGRLQAEVARYNRKIRGCNAALEFLWDEKENAQIDLLAMFFERNSLTMDHAWRKLEAGNYVDFAKFVLRATGLVKGEWQEAKEAKEAKEENAGTPGEQL